MNWLAHLYLSEPNPAFRIGNILPDLVPPSALAGLPEDYLRGARQHRQIDAFTDKHPVVRRSIQRLDPSFRKFGGIIVDVFYDHFLAREWHRFSAVPLQTFADEVYLSFESLRGEIPPEAYPPLAHMKRENWLHLYHSVAGITNTLGRIGRRFRKIVPLEQAASVLRDQPDSLYADFIEFFPELEAHVRVKSD
ncbi:MAG TPA: ACP phosphodiesterase [Verrucomicrobiae bacterium]|jgi:acyl carrier protein phosphodiesterase|nr:ACP phosphodiesterase [Verrucomicrobiae bacterium]